MTTEELIDRIARSSRAGDWLGVQTLIAELKRLMTEEGRPLAGPGAYRLVEALSESTGLAQPAGVNPYPIIDQIKKLSNQRPVDMTALTSSWDSLYTLLANPAVNIETESLREVLRALRAARAFELLGRTADRALAREPGDPTTLCAYSQSLIDTGQMHAGIALLQQVLQQPNLPRMDRLEAHGIAARAYKQIYVDHVKSPHTPPTVRERYRPFLEKAVAHYAAVYDPNSPAEQFWNGINIVALLLLAREDGQKIDNPTRLEPEEIARRLVAALEPQLATTNDPWIIATSGEALLALRDYEAAAQRLGTFARHGKTNVFMLGSAVRQLEQVWRIAPGHSSAGAILAVLKAAQIGQDEAKFTLPGDDLASLRRFTSSTEYRYTETMVDGGNYMKLAELQKVVSRAQGVVGISNSASGNTVGTGFLIRGSDLCESLGNDLYLLTNAHVMSDPDLPGAEPNALAPKHARAKLEAAAGTELKFDSKVVWQSPVTQWDSCLVKVTDHSPGLVPLPIADPGRTFVTEDPDKPNNPTRVSVIGHPLGGPLSLSIVGALTGANGVLVDHGPRTKTEEDPTYLHYRAPTEPGNSGSPVFETETWGVIGLHHMGFNQFEGRPRLKGRSGTTLANQGVCIRSIRRAIAADRKPQRRGINPFKR
jgi:S1-C subfamily serine protease